MIILLQSTSFPFLRNPEKKYNININSGHRVNIYGASGSGKSCIIRAIVGLNNQFNGNIILSDKRWSEITDEKWFQLRKDCFSIVFQQLELFEEMTVVENINLVSNLYPNINSSQIDSISQSLDLKQYFNTKIKYLSVGEKQRVAITRALIRPFTWLILDESFSHLDKNNIQICIELIKSNLNENNAGLILTSHSKNKMFEYNTYIPLD